MSTSTSLLVRCPHCSANVRAGSDWCTLCYTDLRPAPMVVGDVGDEDTASAEPEPPPTRKGKHARRVPANAEEGGAPSAATSDGERLADQLIAELAASEAKNPLGALAGAFDTTAKRAALMLGGGVAAMCLLVILMAALGALL